MENLIFTQLLKQDYRPNLDLFYYKTRNNKEVDFMIRQGTSTTSLIQVAYSVDHPDVQKREIKALIEASEELKCDNLLILTWDYEELREVQNKQIQFLPLWKWLINS